MKIAILGGSFDPPHNAHSAIAKKVIKELLLDQVWLVPCFLHAFEKPLSAPQRRLEMTKFLAAKNVLVSDYEIKKGGISLSIDTINEFAKKYPENNFLWIIGSDQIEDFPKWEGWQDIISKYGLIIVQRSDEKNVAERAKNILQNKELKNIFLISSFGIPDVSSTNIRENVKNGESISNLVPKKVEEYIKKHNLYI